MVISFLMVAEPDSMVSAALFAAATLNLQGK